MGASSCRNMSTNAAMHMQGPSREMPRAANTWRAQPPRRTRLLVALGNVGSARAAVAGAATVAGFAPLGWYVLPVLTLAVLVGLAKLAERVIAARAAAKASAARAKAAAAPKRD